MASESTFMIRTSSKHFFEIFRRRQALIFWLAIVWLLGPSVVSVRGQAPDPLAALGVPTFSSTIPVEQGNISPANGNLHLQIPLGSFSQRGGRQVSISLDYDSTIWYQTSMGWSPFNAPSFMYIYGIGWLNGWHLNVSPGSGTLSYNSSDSRACSYDGMPGWTTYNKFNWTQPDGTVHYFNITTRQGWINQCGNYTSMTIPNGDALTGDGSGYHMYITNVTTSTVIGPDGTQYVDNAPPQNFVEDSNGNYPDTSGRNLLGLTVNNGNTFTYSVPNESGGTSSFVVTTESVNVSTSFQSAGSTLPEYPSSLQTPTIGVIQSIQLPDGTNYSFGYDSGTAPGHYGLLTSMKLPTGSQITYAYSNFADSMYIPNLAKHITRGISSRTTPDGTWTYTPAVLVQCTSALPTNCQQQLKVTKPAYNGRSDNDVYKYIINNGAWLIEADYYNGAVSPANLLVSQTQGWDFSHPCPTTVCGILSVVAWEITQLSATISLPMPSGPSANQTTQFCYDIVYGNLLYKWEWNFYTTSVIHDPNPPPSCSLYTGVTPPDRTTTTTYLNSSPYVAKNIVNRPASITVANSGGTTVAQTIYSYDDWGLPSGPTGIVNHDDTNFGATNNVRGNLTQTKRWLNTTGTWLITKNYYDILGNLTQTIDPNLNPTNFDYTDNFYGVSPSPATAAYVTKMTSPVTNGVNHISRMQYYFGTGYPSAKCGENFPAASTCAYGLPAPQPDYASYTYDNLNRPMTINMGDGGQTTWSYGILPSTATGTTKINGSLNLVSATILDGLGRKSQTQTSSGQGTVYTDTTYDSVGRLHSVSNPHFSTSSSTDGIVTYSSYDGLDRVTLITEQDGSTLATSYAGNCKTATDEATKVRKSCYDGFGRMTGVWEDPGLSPHLNYETDYQYDLLNNLTSVIQSGSRQRSFVYDSLSRLEGASNPESGTVCYAPYSAGTCQYQTASGYDANGNLIYKTDARGITTTYTYDALDRVLSKTYSDGITPQATFLYDVSSTNGVAIQNPVGRLVKDSTNLNSSNFSYTIRSYDPMGRIVTQWQESPVRGSYTCGCAYQTHATYNLAGLPTMYTNDYSVNSFYISYDSAMHPTGLTTSPYDSNHPQTLASGITYWPVGQVKGMTYGNNLTEATYYNSRLQPCRINVNSSSSSLSDCTTSVTGNIQDFQYGWNLGGSDNGNVASWSATGQQNFNRTYGYEALNRISGMSSPSDPSGCTGYNWTYDAWGNRLTQTGTGGTNCQQSSLGFSSNNQMNNSGLVYDASGNLTYDGTHHYSYDAENRLISVDSGATATYIYDAEGRRVQKTTSSGSIGYVSDIVTGNVIEETNGSDTLQTGYIYLNGQMLAQYKNGTTYFAHLDHLGSTRLMTNVSGGVYDSMDYLPFGEQIAGSSGTTHKFTGKERDSESGLDNFGTRYDSSQYGRFMTPDWSEWLDPVPNADLRDPQTLNLYAYVRNNPLTFTDPDGHDHCSGGDGSDPDTCTKNKGTWVIGNEPQQQQKQANLTPQLPNLGPMPSPYPVRSPIGEPPMEVPPVGINPVSTLVMVDLALLVYDVDAAIKLKLAYSQSANRPGVEPTPTTNKDIFEPVKGRPGKRNKITGEIWEKDKFHKDHWEVYKNQKEYEKPNGKRDREVWDDGRPKGQF